MSIASQYHYQVDLSRGVQVTPLGHLLFTGDKNGDVYRIKVTNDGQAVDITGAAVNAYMMRADHVTVPLTGKVENGEAVVTLDASCYAVTGRAVLVIKMAQGESITTIFAGECAVMRSSSDTIADPGGVIPSLEELLAQIALIEQATASATAAAASANAVANEVGNKLQSGELNGPPGKDGPQGAPGAPGVSITGVSIETGGVDAGGGVSWNDLQDKPFGYTTEEIFPPSDMLFEWEEGEGAYVTGFEYAVPLAADDILDIVWDGKKYSCKQLCAGAITMFGNLSVAGLEDSGEPFFGLLDSSSMMIADMTTQHSVTRNIAVYAQKAKKIDRTFLPFSVTTFYIGIEDNYMYLDSDRTTKASAVDVLAAVNAGIVSLYFSNAAARVQPLIIQPGSRYAYAQVILDKSSTISTFYTAEYVFET